MVVDQSARHRERKRRCKRRTSEAVILASDHAALASRVGGIRTIARRKPWIAGAIAGVGVAALAVAVTLTVAGDDTTKEAPVMGGRAICRAVFPELLRRGEQVGVRVTIQNVTDADLTVLGVATLSVQDQDGRGAGRLLPCDRFRRQRRYRAGRDARSVRGGCPCQMGRSVDRDGSMLPGRCACSRAGRRIVRNSIRPGDRDDPSPISTTSGSLPNGSSRLRASCRDRTPA